MKMAIVGNGDRMSACLKKLSNNGYDKTLKLISNETNQNELYKVSRSIQPDLMVLIGYNHIIKQPLIDYMNERKGIINLHGGKLPEYRGSSVLNWQIINGEREIGLSIIQLDKGIDTGMLLCEDKFSLGINDNIEEVKSKVNPMFSKMLIRVIKGIERNDLTPYQQSGHPCYYGHRTSIDSKINWNMNAEQIHNLVRASSEGYEAFTYLENKKILILKTELMREEYVHSIGKCFLTKNRGKVVMAGDRGLLVRSSDPVIKLGDYLQ